MVVGGAGGPTIITGALQVLLNVLDQRLDAQAASAAPRIHHQWMPEVLALEPDIARDVVEALRAPGPQGRGARRASASSTCSCAPSRAWRRRPNSAAAAAPAGY